MANKDEALSGHVGDNKPGVPSENDSKVTSQMVADTGEELNDVATGPKLEVVGLRDAFPLTRDGYLLPDDEFFRRPVVLKTYSLTSASVVDAQFVWALWANDPMVASRLKGRAHWRGTLCLKFDVAASPYQYGLIRFGVQYGPYVSTRTAYGASQLLGVDVDVGIPGSHELRCPFIFPKDYISCVSGAVSVFDPGATLTDARAIGFLVMAPIAPIARADSASEGTVTVRIRGWMEKFEGVGPTRCNIVAQSGAVSGTARVVAKATGMLSKVPVIGGIAGVVSSVATAVGDVAAFFGFSRVRDEGAVQRGVGSWSLTDAPYHGASTALTSARALSADVTHLGVGEEDDMALSRIFGHQSLLWKVLWATTDAAGADILNLPVDPMVAFNSSGSVHQPTSLTGACLPFKYWRGSIIYTIRIVCSGFHTGVLRIAYEPGADAGNSTIDATWPIGSTENCLLTCEPGAECDIQVGFTSHMQWRPLRLVWNPTSGFLLDKFANGKLHVTVENPLQAPLSTASVWIAVYMRGGPDFQVFGIKDTIPKYGFQATPSAAPSGVGGSLGTSIVEGGDDMGPLRPQSALLANNPPRSKCLFGGPPSGVERLTGAVFGEPLLSLRALMKRFVSIGYVLATADGTTNSLTEKEIRAAMSMYPPVMGYTAGTGVGIVYNAVNSVWRIFPLGFVGVRGGVRVRVIDANVNRGSDGSSVGFPFRCSVYPTTTGATSLTGDPAYIRALIGSPSGGPSAPLDAARAELVDVEVPDYRTFSFHYAGQYVGGGLPDTSLGMAEYPIIVISKECTNFTKHAFYVDLAAADDFSYIHWQGFPSMTTTT